MGRRAVPQAQGVIQSAQYALPYHYLPRRYVWHHLIEYEVYLEEVLRVIQQLQPVSHLDVGCGDGRLLYERGTGIGCDLDARAVKWARGKGVAAFVMDAARAIGTFELVTAIEVLEHIPPGRELSFVKTLADKCNGHVLLTVPTTNVKVPAKHFRHYDEESLLKVVKPYLKVNSLRWIIHQPKWWTLAERIPSTRHEPWLKAQLAKRIDANERNGRHLLLIGEPR